MRVTDQQMFGLVLNQFQSISQKTLEAQQQASSGKRVSKPSDDPIAFGRIVLDKSDLAQNGQWLRNIDSGSTRLAQADSTLGQVDTTLSRLRELAVSARNDTNTANDRTVIAKEVRSLQRELVQLSNTEVNGQRIFAGTKTDADPFVLGVGDDVTYVGNNESQSVAVGQNQTIQVTLSGSQVFSGPTTNVFGSIKNLLSSLETNNGAGIETGIGDLDQAISQVANARGQIGALDNRLSTTKSALQDTGDLLQTALSNDEDIDFAEAITNLTRQQTALQAAARSANVMFSNSLLNFLK
ncbi:MAG TPA: flagellar hook-associated protein FlgL [Nitrospiraceae bacterium]|nr:flagellar hook-associated protein FlgL [Nitrospiraceae bacterium]